MIPDEAVEAAARAMWDDSDPVRKKARPDWATMKDDANWVRAATRNRRDAQLALEAAAPHMIGCATTGPQSASE